MARKTKPAPTADEAPAAPPPSLMAEGPMPLPTAHLVPHPAQAEASRRDDLAALVESLRLHGLIEPVLVRSGVYEAPGGAPRYQILSGHRRVAAARELGWDTIPARVVSCDDSGALGLLITSNAARLELDALAASEAVGLLVERLGLWRAAALLGRPARWVAERLALRRLSARWRERFYERPWSLWSTATWGVLASLAPEEQEAFLDAPAMHHLRGDPELDAKVLAEALRDWIRVLGRAPFDVEASYEVAGETAPACAACPHTTMSVPLLFETGEVVDVKQARCLHRACWEAKAAAALRARLEAARKEHGPEVVAVLPPTWEGPKPKGARVLKGHQYEPAKKGAKGAVPAVSAASASGRVTWVRPMARAATRRAKASADDGRRRWARVHYERRCEAEARSRVQDLLNGALGKADGESIDLARWLAVTLLDARLLPRPKGKKGRRTLVGAAEHLVKAYGGLSGLAFAAAKENFASGWGLRDCSRAEAVEVAAWLGVPREEVVAAVEAAVASVEVPEELRPAAKAKERAAAAPSRPAARKARAAKRKAAK